MRAIASQSRDFRRRRFARLPPRERATKKRSGIIASGGRAKFPIARHKRTKRSQNGTHLNLPRHRRLVRRRDRSTLARLCDPNRQSLRIRRRDPLARPTPHSPPSSAKVWYKFSPRSALNRRRLLSLPCVRRTEKLPFVSIPTVSPPPARSSAPTNPTSGSFSRPRWTPTPPSDDVDSNSIFSIFSVLVSTPQCSGLEPPFTARRGLRSRNLARAALSSTGGSAVSRSPDLGSALDVERVVGVRANDARATNVRHARASNARVRASYVAVYARARERERAIRSQRLVAI